MHIKEILQNYGLTICALIIIAIYISGILTAWCTPATGSEINIYSSTPLYFWIAIIITYVMGIFGVLYSHSNISSKKIYCYFGYIFLFLSAIALIGLTSIRGYYSMNLISDTAVHFAWISEILNTNHFGLIQQNSYPLSHIASAIYSLLTGLQLETIVRLVPHIGICIFLFGTILLAKAVYHDKKILHFIIIFASLVPIGSVAIIGAGGLREPTVLCFGYYLLPFIFYLMICCCTRKSKLLFLPATIAIIFVTLIHPMTGAVIVAFLFSYLIMQLFFSRRKKEKFFQSETIQRIAILLGVCVFTFIIWHFGLRIVTIGNILMSILSFAGIGSNDITASYFSTMDTASGFGYGIATYVRMASLPILIYGLIPLSALYYLYRKKYSDFRERQHGIIIIFSAFILILTAVVAFTASGANTSRFMALLTMCGILCSGYLCCKLFYMKKLNQIPIMKILSVGIIISVLIVSVLSYYPSPYTLSNTRQDTYEEIQTVSTLLPYISLDGELQGITYTAIGRYANYLYGVRNIIVTKQNGIEIVVSKTLKSYVDTVPFHFGYDKHSQFSEGISSPTYLFVTKKDKEYYDTYYPEIKEYRYTDQDFMHIEFDQTIEKYYDNGEIAVYLSKPNTH